MILSHKYTFKFLKEFIIIVTGIPILLYYLIRNAQNKISLTFLTYNISGIGGVTKKRTKTSCCMNLNYNNAHDGAKLTLPRPSEISEKNWST